MPYVFISYAREDKDWAVNVRNALSARGFRVWWDKNLLVADPWQERIESALANASSVVVLWSSHAVDSDWVHHEASFAKFTKKVIFVRLDNAEIPPIFSGLQSATLVGWNKAYDTKEMDDLISAIKRAHRRRKYSVLIKVIPLFIALIAILLSLLAFSKSISSSSLSDATSELKALNSRYQVIVKERDSIRKSQDDLSSKYQKVVKERDSIRKSQDDLSSKYQKVVKERDSIRKSQDDLSSKYQKVVKERDSIRKSQDDLSSKYQKVVKERDSIRKSRDDLNSEYQKVVKERDSIRDSLTALQQNSIQMLNTPTNPTALPGTLNLPTTGTLNIQTGP